MTEEKKKRIKKQILSKPEMWPVLKLAAIRLGDGVGVQRLGADIIEGWLKDNRDRLGLLMP